MLDDAVELYTKQNGTPYLGSCNLRKFIIVYLLMLQKLLIVDIPQNLEGIEYARHMVFICRSSSVQLFLFDALIPDMTLPKGLQEYLETKR